MALKPIMVFLNCQRWTGRAVGNNGGIITLLDPQGFKHHGVCYTKEQALSGWTVLF